MGCCASQHLRLAKREQKSKPLDSFKQKKQEKANQVEGEILHKWKFKFSDTQSLKYRDQMYLDQRWIEKLSKINKQRNKNYVRQYNLIANLLYLAGFGIYDEIRITPLINELFQNILNYKQIIISFSQHFKQILRDQLINIIDKSELLITICSKPKTIKQAIKKASLKQYTDSEIDSFVKQLKQNVQNYFKIINSNKLLTFLEKVSLIKAIQLLPKIEIKLKAQFIKNNLVDEQNQ